MTMEHKVCSCWIGEFGLKFQQWVAGCTAHSELGSVMMTLSLHREDRSPWYERLIAFNPINFPSRLSPICQPLQVAQDHQSSFTTGPSQAFEPLLRILISGHKIDNVVLSSNKNIKQML
jgi:hypothetical protein